MAALVETLETEEETRRMLRGKDVQDLNALKQEGLSIRSPN